jgi:hypothetical protein
MESRQELLWESIRRALRALGLPAFQLPRLIRLRLQLESVDAEIVSLVGIQREPSHASWNRKNVDQLRSALRERHLLPIAQDAPLLLDGMPGIRDEFRVPPKHGADQDLFGASDRILANASRYKKTFVEGGWNEDFIDNAREAADTLKVKLSEVNTDIDRRSRATASLPAAIAKGREIMRSIDRTVLTLLSAKDTSLTVWKSAYRVPKRMGRPRKKKNSRRPPPTDTLEA